MPLPGGIVYITVHGTFLDSFDNPSQGSITFAPPPVLVDPGSSVIYSRPVSANLDSTGSFSVSLVCTDNPPLVPVGWSYTVTERIAGAAPRIYQVFLPHTLGSSVDFSTVTPIPSVTGVPAIIPSGVVAPGYGGLAYSQTWSGSNTYTGTTVFSGPVTLSGYLATGSSASGDLSGTYPGPTVSAVKGVAVSGTPATGQVLTATSTSAATWATPTTGGVQIGGDLGGTLGSPTVTATHLGSPLPLAQGGTNAATAAGARTQLGLGTSAVLDVDATAADFQPTGTPAAGAVNKLADAGHRHPHQPWEFHVADYGAAGDNTTDDTAAINAAVTAAGTYLSAHGYAKVLFDPKTYLLAGNPTTGGATQGNALIPLPVIAETAQKGILVFQGTTDQTALYHWHQTTPQRAGTVLRSTYNAGDTIPVSGEVSVIGGPTFHYKGDPPSTWDNLLVVVDGIGVEISDFNCCGFDFRCIGEANVPNAGVLATSLVTGAPAVPPANWSFGLAMPVANNNDNCNIGYFSVEGMVYGLIVYEHVQAESVRIIDCFDGLVSWSSSGFPHRSHFSYLSIEGCQQPIVLAGAMNKLNIDVCDIEWGGGHIIHDVGATPSIGRIGLGSNGGDGNSLAAALSTDPTSVLVANGPLGLEVINLDMAIGAVTAPAIPSSGTPLQNPFWRHAEVTVAGGTVTQIAIDGANKLLTSGTFIVPSGKTITLTYSVAPSWSWTTLGG